MDMDNHVKLVNKFEFTSRQVSTERTLSLAEDAIDPDCYGLV
jgi:hypothetical protein